MYRKIVRMMLACIVALALLLPSALADEPELASTQSFLAYLDSRDIKYTYKGVLSETEHETVQVKFNGENYDTLTVNLYFDPNGDSVSLRIYNLANATAGENYIMSTIQKLNKAYKYAKFVYDDSDSTIQAEMDLRIDPNDCGEVVSENMMMMLNVVDYEEVHSMLSALE